MSGIPRKYLPKHRRLLSFSSSEDESSSGPPVKAAKLTESGTLTDELPETIDLNAESSRHPMYTSTGDGAITKTGGKQDGTPTSFWSKSPSQLPSLFAGRFSVAGDHRPEPQSSADDNDPDGRTTETAANTSSDDDDNGSEDVDDNGSAVNASFSGAADVEPPARWSESDDGSAVVVVSSEDHNDPDYRPTDEDDPESSSSGTFPDYSLLSESEDGDACVNGEPCHGRRVQKKCRKKGSSGSGGVGGGVDGGGGGDGDGDGGGGGGGGGSGGGGVSVVPKRSAKRYPKVDFSWSLNTDVPCRISKVGTLNRTGRRAGVATAMNKRLRKDVKTRVRIVDVQRNNDGSLSIGPIYIEVCSEQQQRKKKMKKSRDGHLPGPF